MKHGELELLIKETIRAELSDHQHPCRFDITVEEAKEFRSCLVWLALQRDRGERAGRIIIYTILGTVFTAITVKFLGVFGLSIKG